MLPRMILLVAGFVAGVVEQRIRRREMNELRQQIAHIEQRQGISERLVFGHEVYRGPDKPLIYNDRIGSLERRVLKVEDRVGIRPDVIRK